MRNGMGWFYLFGLIGALSDRMQPGVFLEVLMVYGACEQCVSPCSMRGWEGAGSFSVDV